MSEREKPQKQTGPALNPAGLQVIILLGALVLTAVGAFAAGYLAGRPPGGEPLQVFNEVWSLIDRDFYYAKPPEAERVYGAIRGMLGTLDDPHTIFLPPAAASKDVAIMQGQVGGVGAIVALNEANQVVITEARRGWPAALAGAQAGDIIIAVNGQSLEGMSLGEAVDLIRGPLGTEVELTLQRPGQAASIVLKVTRGQINVYGQMLDDKIAYLSLDLFTGTAPDDVSVELAKLLSAQPRALIFDLRGNSGGYLNEALRIADLFLPEGLIATEKTTSGQSRRFTSQTGDIGEEIPLVILVDGRSASASEIVAGAVQDRGRGVLVGQRTFGKGSVQVLHMLSDGSQLRVTQGAWYTPDETPIERRDGHEGGLAPDVIVELPERPQPGIDPVMEAAIAYIQRHY